MTRATIHNQVRTKDALAEACGATGCLSWAIGEGVALERPDVRIVTGSSRIYATVGGARIAVVTIDRTGGHATAGRNIARLDTVAVCTVITLVVIRCVLAMSGVIAVLNTNVIRATNTIIAVQINARTTEEGIRITNLSTVATETVLAL
jgi:hypothetical protein